VIRRTFSLSLLASAVLASAASAADAPPLYARESRVAHIEAALVALEVAPAAVLRAAYEHARALEQGACSVGAVRLRVECLLVASRRYCESTTNEKSTRDCSLYMDILVSNVLAERFLISRERRYEIIAGNIDYRPALIRELRRVQGTLAVDFRLHAQNRRTSAAMASDIDRYCHATADENRISYQICVSSLVFFIKGST
jgi:hypothetical protein